MNSAVKMRLDQVLAARGLTRTRSQAGSLAKLGRVKVNSRVVTKPGALVSPSDKIAVSDQEQYVSRAGLKLASVAEKLRLDFQGKTVLDVGSSTGGFTDYALKHGAKKVIAVDVGTNQMHPSLRTNPRVDLHEKTDIRDFANHYPKNKNYHKKSDRFFYDNFGLVLVDVSFISLREILPSVLKLMDKTETRLVAMAKPQFESGNSFKHKGVIKNEAMRRQILKDFEVWAKSRFAVLAKADSEVAGEKGNRERFYLLKKVTTA